MLVRCRAVGGSAGIDGLHEGRTLVQHHHRAAAVEALAPGVEGAPVAEELRIFRRRGRIDPRRLRVAFAAHCRRDRKSTRLNSSHPSISYAVFCLKKKIYTNLSP